MASSSQTKAKAPKAMFEFGVHNNDTQVSPSSSNILKQFTINLFQ